MDGVAARLPPLPRTGSGGQRERRVAAGEVAEAGELPPGDDEGGVVVDDVEAELPGVLGGLPAAEGATLAADRTEGGRVAPALGGEVSAEAGRRCLPDGVGQIGGARRHLGRGDAVAGVVEADQGVEVDDAAALNSATLTKDSRQPRACSVGVRPARRAKTRRRVMVKRRHSSGACQLKATCPV